MAADKARKDKANAAFQKKQTEIVKQGKQDLSDSEKRTADARAELDKQAAVKEGKDKSDAELAAVRASKDKADADFQQQQAEIVKQGKQDLSDSEKRTADALAELATLAAVKEEERGLVVTLSGGVLFRSAESTLLSSAQVKLDQVANALLAVRARNLIVEGHTDSQGSESYNQGLSQRRADAVRDYLVKRGYPADRIQSRGKSKGSPIADNASPEGRANNRRVEIIIERESPTSNR
jgi:outer membrane protein OmpA-like peptidoglycan-associated protein